LWNILIDQGEEMEINKIINLISNPKPYDKGTSVMWTDKYISKQLLELHLNPDTDTASRKEETIKKTIQWILKELNKEDAEILDLGCGPGLYTEKIAKLGHKVTGIDFSQNSIAYAKEIAKQNNLNINYICKNYLDLDFDNQFDLIIMIYCDFGVLSIEQREVLLGKIYRALKQGGIFIFDALNKYAIDNLNFQKSWEFSQKGFWKDKPYLYLSESFHYPEQKAILDQHIVIDEDDEFKIYRFWNHYFDGNDIEEKFTEVGFNRVQSYQNIIEGDKGVTFYKAKK
jgi:2-polyprenyl-3-methyl-5-hydroxy-6-metoxy-1,4-benzoquinol methylase